MLKPVNVKFRGGGHNFIRLDTTTTIFIETDSIKEGICGTTADGYEIEKDPETGLEYVREYDLVLTGESPEWVVSCNSRVTETDEFLEGDLDTLRTLDYLNKEELTYNDIKEIIERAIREDTGHPVFADSSGQEYIIAYQDYPEPGDPLTILTVWELKKWQFSGPGCWEKFDGILLYDEMPWEVSNGNQIYIPRTLRFTGDYEEF